MFSKIKMWWRNRRQEALCANYLCDCEVMSIHTKTEGCQEYTRTVKMCPVCGRKEVEGSLDLLATKMNQVFPKPKKKKAAKKPAKKAVKKAA